ncbi:MAG: DUF1156 domain-containing protein [Dehalococcoidia bacterium]|nr:DUF1156 domain-containing protein [Dehalococcoidia bacterium]MYD29930.1 DUF1156 domain-containing protein [Dehalococcoidia bacterium]
MTQETPPVITRKKLIEVALPLDAINAASAKEKMPGIGAHPRGLHLWWARRPLAAARAVLFAQLVDDPSSWPELFLTEEKQDQERQRLFGIIEELVKWENTTNEQVIEAAREEIRASWRRTCEDNRNHPQAAELFDPGRPPAFHDPFAGGGSIPLEAQRLGLEANASDLNPVAVLINKAMIEIPPRFAGEPPVNSESRTGQASIEAAWKGARGLAEDVRYYGKWMRDEAENRIGHLYPRVTVTEAMARERPDLKPYVGRELAVIAWLWARTVKSPNPAFAEVDVPLASTFVLSKKKGKEAYVEPVVEDGDYRFTVKAGPPPESATKGTKLARGANFECIMSGIPLTGDYIKSEGRAGRMGAQLMAIVAEGDRSRVYFGPLTEHEAVVNKAELPWVPDGEIAPDRRSMFTPLYGLTHFKHLFTDRQLVALTTLSDLVGEARDFIRVDAVAAGFPDDGVSLRDGGTGATAYAEAVSVYLAFALDRVADFSNSCTRWVPSNEKAMSLYGKQAIAMTWDYPEVGVLNDVVGGLKPAAEYVAKCIATLPVSNAGEASLQSALENVLSRDRVVSTDPPYYDNVGYADLSDFFYAWLRSSLSTVYPEIFATLETPKTEELVASPYRHGSKGDAEGFFLDGMSKALQLLASQSSRLSPVTIYYAFKQSERGGSVAAGSTGWETFLDAAIQAGFSVTGTWPMRTEQAYRMIGMGSNALASSVVLACRPRPVDAPVATRREFVDALRADLPGALTQMQSGNIAPVDLAQAAIGPGMAVFTRYSKVLDASGEPVSVRDALALINQTLDETLAEQEGDFDADTRWALAWFEESGFGEGDFGVAETLSKAKNTSVEGMVDAGILVSRAGKVRLLPPDELPEDWDPQTERRLTVWESVHHLVRVLHLGEEPASEVVAQLGVMAEPARELAYRLYRICDQKNRPQEALDYNTLIQVWPDLASLARQQAPVRQGTLLAPVEEA